MPRQYSDEEIKVLQAMTKAQGKLGTFRFNKAGLIEVANKTFADVTDAVLFRDKTGIKMYESIIQGSAISARPNVGGAHYAMIEGFLDKLAQIDSKFVGVTAERGSYSLKKGKLDAIIDSLRDKETGRFTGFLHTNEKELHSLRLKLSSGEYLTDTQVSEALETVFGIDFKSEKYIKRLNELFSAQAFGGFLPAGKKLNVATFVPSMSDEADGATLASSNMLKVRAQQMLQRAKSLETDFNIGDMSEEAVEARREAKIIRGNVRKLMQLAREGGSSQDFRALGLLGSPELSDLPGMVKGDVIYRPHREFMKAARWMNERFGLNLTEEAIANLDAITPQGNMTPQLTLMPGIGDDASSYLTLRMNEARGRVFVDAQTLISTGGRLSTLDEVSDHTYGVITSEMQEFMESGKLPVSYRESLQEILNRETPTTGTILNLREQQARARSILERERMGLAPTPELQRDILKGMREGIIEMDEKYVGSPKFIAPGTFSAHMRPSLYSQALGEIDDDLVDMEMRYIPKTGLVMNTRTYSNIKHLTGGSDFDDALNDHMRYFIDDNGNLQFRGIITRSPNARGETAVVRMSPVDDPQILDLLAEKDERFKTEVQEVLGKRNTIDAVARAEADLANAEEFLRTARGTKERRRAERRILNAEAQRARARSIAEGIDIVQVNQEIEELTKRMITPASREDLRLFKSFTTVNGDRMPLKSFTQTTFDDWVEKQKLRNPAFDPRSLLPKSSEEMNKEIARLTAGLSEMTQNNQRVIGRILATRRVGGGGLGGFMNMSMLSDTVAWQLEEMAKAGQEGLEGILPAVNIEDFIDLLTQGTSDRGFTLEDLAMRRTAFYHGIAEAVVQHGAKLPSMVFQHRGRYERSNIENAIRALDPTFFDNQRLEDFMGDSFFERAATRHAEVVADIESFESGLLSRALDRDAISGTYFDIAHEEQAADIFDRMKIAQEYFKGESSRHFDDPIMSALAEEVDLKKQHAIATRAVVQEEFGRYITDGKLSDEGVNVLGAFIKQARPFMGRELNQDVLTPLVNYADVFFGAQRGDLFALEQAAEIAETVEDRDRLLGMLAARREYIDTGLSEEVFRPVAEIPEELRGLLDVARRGSRRKERLGDIFGTASDVTSRGSVGGETVFDRFSREGIKNLWDIPLTRKATFGGLAALGFSAIYQKFRDRTPEDLSGPPLLPGGNPYEEGMESFPDPAMAMEPVSTNRGGVTYKVIAEGNFDPINFQNMIQEVTGGSPVTGSYYSSGSDRIPQPRYNRRPAPEGLFGNL